MPGIERDGEELPRLSPGVGCDSTAQGEVIKGSFTIVNIYVLVQRVLGGGEGGPRPAYYF